MSRSIISMNELNIHKCDYISDDSVMLYGGSFSIFMFLFSTAGCRSLEFLLLLFKNIWFCQFWNHLIASYKSSLKIYMNSLQLKWLTLYLHVINDLISLFKLCTILLYFNKRDIISRCRKRTVMKEIQLFLLHSIK